MQNKKIIIHAPRISYTIGGSEKKLVQIAKSFLHANNDVTFLTTAPFISSYFVDFIRNYPQARIISFERDILTTQLRSNYVTVDPKVINIGGVPPSVKIAKMEYPYIEDIKAFICAGEYIKNKFLQMYAEIDEKKVYSIPNGIDDVFFADQNKEVKKDIDIYYAGRLTHRKGIHLILHAIKIIKQRYDKKLMLSIVGEGEYMNELISLSVELGIDDQIDFVGHRLPSEVSYIARRSKIFVYDVLEPEAFGTSVLEAMASDCVVITSGLGGISNYLINDFNGIIVQQDDIGSLAEKIHQVVENWNFYSRMRHNAYKTSTDYSEAKMVSAYQQIYEKVISIK